jgi:Fe2+ transport system protein FeoA
MPRLDVPSEQPDAPVPLTSLAPGCAGVVERVDDRDDPIARRLLDLGFVPPTEVRVLRRAPLGDPVAYEVRGSRLCLRQSEAKLIWVRPLGAREA